MPFCLRTSRPESDAACTSLIVATGRSKDLLVCRSCPAGMVIMATARFGRRPRAVAAPERSPTPAPVPQERQAAHPEYLLRTLRYIVPRHRRDKRLGVRFLAMVARQFDFEGDAAAFHGACEAAGLCIVKRPLLALQIDERLHAFIREEAPC